MAKADAVAARLRAACIALVDPDPLTVFDNVYSEPHSVLARQRDEYSRYLRTFVGADSDNADSGNADPDNADPGNAGSGKPDPAPGKTVEGATR
jgi:hypothetical protein